MNDWTAFSTEKKLIQTKIQNKFDKKNNIEKPTYKNTPLLEIKNLQKIIEIFNILVV